MREASFYKKLDETRVHCFLCAQHCRIEPGDRGKCGVRENRDGTLWSLVYGKPIAQHVDPIEKKPLYHVFPGTLSYSIGTAGCNLSCLFCQNADIAHGPKTNRGISGGEAQPDEVVSGANDSGCTSIAYTYTEPVIFMEYALDVARRAKAANLANVFVTNGYTTRRALDEAAPLLDAANVDLKGFTDDFYRERCGARLKPVLWTIEELRRRGVWVEVTTLIIPGLNDSRQELRQLADFLVSVDSDMPWHVSAFHPSYRMLDRPPTPADTLHTARSIGLEAGLRYVYVGNIPSPEGRNTYCSSCGALLIDRSGFSSKTREMRRGACSRCNTVLPGVGLDVAP
jgi:pyruvate formate lyase activating enzyme